MGARVYVGLDGVFNSSGAPRSWGLESFDSTDYGGYTFIWSTSAVSNFLAFCHENDVELVWLTSWWEDISVLARLLGFAQFGADARVIEEVGPSWFAKADALMQDLEDFPVAEGEKWIWLDPAASDAEQSLEFLRLHPEFFDGLTPPVFEEIGITPALMSHLRSQLQEKVMRSTIKIDGVYGVEIGGHAIITAHRLIYAKLLVGKIERMEPNQTDGEVTVTPNLLHEAERINRLSVSGREQLLRNLSGAMPGEEIADILESDEREQFLSFHKVTRPEVLEWSDEEILYAMSKGL